MQFLNRAEAPLICTARIIPGGHNTSAREERQRARWGLRDPSWAQGAAPGPRLCEPAAAPAAAFNLDCSLLASGAGGKPVQMGVLSVTTPLPPPRSRADVARCSAVPSHAVCEGAPRTVHARPCAPWLGPAPTAEQGAGCSLGGGVGGGEHNREPVLGGPVEAPSPQLARPTARSSELSPGAPIGPPLGGGIALGPGQQGSPGPGNPR